MTNLAALPTTGHANCDADVAKFLREMADNVEQGCYGPVRQIVVTMESGGQLETWVAGGPCDTARLVGLMYMAAGFKSN